MDKIYRQVSVKERLPEIEKYYHTNQGTVYFDADQKHFRVPFDPTYTITYWLEEVELPSDNDVFDEAHSQHDDAHEYLAGLINGFTHGANYILKTLKGEKSNG